MSVDRQPQMSSIGAVVLRGCGCVEDHGLVALHHKDTEVVREWYIHRLHHHHGHSLEEAEALAQRHPDDLYAHVVGLPAAVPKIVAKCFVHTHEGKGIAGGFANPLVVNLGFPMETGLIGGLGGTVPKFIAWGNQVTPNLPSPTDTGLQSPAAEARTTGGVSQVTTTANNDTLQIAGTITSTSTQTITEAALFDHVTSVTLFLRGTFTGIAVNSGDSIAFTFKVQET